MKWLIIGISGPTCCGKTSAMKKIQEYIDGSIIISQDDYFLPQADPRHLMVPELNHFNWEILSSLDMQKMHTDVLKIIESSNSITTEADKKTKVLIIEGFTIYNYKPIANLIHLKYFFLITKEECWNRRKTRIYDPPDVPGYFEKIVWPEYIKHKAEIMADTNLYKSIRFLDGTKTVENLSQIIINGIETYDQEITVDCSFSSA